MGFLSKVPILENLTEAERHIVVDALEPVTYKKGDVLMHQGDPGEDFFIIIEGNVVCTQFAKKGKDLSLDLISVTCVLMCFLKGYPINVLSPHFSLVTYLVSII